jgi:hypothetical protein
MCQAIQGMASDPDSTSKLQNHTNGKKNSLGQLLADPILLLYGKINDEG